MNHSNDVWADMGFTDEQRDHWHALGFTDAVATRDIVGIYLSRTNDEIRKFSEGATP